MCFRTCRRQANMSSGICSMRSLMMVDAGCELPWVRWFSIGFGLPLVMVSNNLQQTLLLVHIIHVLFPIHPYVLKQWSAQNSHLEYQTMERLVLFNCPRRKSQHQKLCAPVSHLPKIFPRYVCLVDFAWMSLYAIVCPSLTLIFIFVLSFSPREFSKAQKFSSWMFNMWKVGNLWRRFKLWCEQCMFEILNPWWCLHLGSHTHPVIYPQPPGNSMPRCCTNQLLGA